MPNSPLGGDSLRARVLRPDELSFQTKRAKTTQAKFFLSQLVIKSSDTLDDVIFFKHSKIVKLFL